MKYIYISNGHWGENVEELYCEKCGSELDDNFIFHKYDVKTGDKLVKCKSICPNKKWYNSHSSFFRSVYVEADGSKFFQIFREIKENN